jgi:hypothetical protein
LPLTLVQTVIEPFFNYMAVGLPRLVYYWFARVNELELYMVIAGPLVKELNRETPGHCR